MTSALASLDPFALYLIAVNALSFVVHACAFAIVRRSGRGNVRRPALNILTLAGGGAGTLVALVLWDRHVTKDNSLAHVLAVSSVLFWVAVAGFRYVAPFDPVTFAANLSGVSVALVCYLALINLVAFVCFAVDKWRAVRGAWRVPEVTLLGLSLAGGALGGLGAMVLLRHKIRSPQFAWGVPMALASWLALLAFLVSAGLVS